MPGEAKTCQYCGEEHAGRICSLIRAMDFHEISGSLKRVEFFEQKPPCQHVNKDTSMGTMGWERWRCKDCGLEFEKAMS